MPVGVEQAGAVGDTGVRGQASGFRKLKTPPRIPRFLTFDDIRTLLGYTGSIRRNSTVLGQAGLRHDFDRLLPGLPAGGSDLDADKSSKDVSEREVYLLAVCW